MSDNTKLDTGRAKEYLKEVGLIQSPYLSQERVVRHMTEFANQQNKSTKEREQRLVEVLKQNIGTLNHTRSRLKHFGKATNELDSVIERSEKLIEELQPEPTYPNELNNPHDNIC